MKNRLVSILHHFKRLISKSKNEENVVFRSVAIQGLIELKTMQCSIIRLLQQNKARILTFLVDVCSIMIDSY